MSAIHWSIVLNCKNRLGFSLLLFTLTAQYFKRFSWSIQLKPLTFGLFLLASMFRVSLFRPSRQSNPSQCRSHVRQRKIQISPPPGEPDWSNALPQGQQRQSNPPPRHLYIDRCILVLLCIWGQFSMYKPLGSLYLEGRFNREFFALPVWGVYIILERCTCIFWLLRYP